MIYVMEDSRLITKSQEPISLGDVVACTHRASRRGYPAPAGQMLETTTMRYDGRVSLRRRHNADGPPPPHGLVRWALRRPTPTDSGTGNIFVITTIDPLTLAYERMKTIDGQASSAESTTEGEV